MFEKTRLQLTAWYLVIIMGISILFSIAFYSVTTQEVQRLTTRMRRERIDPYNIYRIPSQVIQQRISDLEDAKERLLFSLIFLNGIIFVISGWGGYFLAGRTLQPIQDMVTEQNRFITDASHELRTPLTATRTAIEVALRDKGLTLSDAKNVLEGSLEDISSMQSLSDNLLRLSQAEKGEGMMGFSKVALHEIMGIAIKKVLPLAKKKQITIIPKIQKTYVKGDSKSLEELGVIFLDNAIKYSPKRSTVTLSIKRNDGHVILTIEDNGIGMKKEEIPKIFDRFYRAEKSRTKNTAEGYGLGLSIAMKIIEEHKGTIKVESEMGKGTTFAMSFPAIR